MLMRNAVLSRCCKGIARCYTVQCDARPVHARRCINGLYRKLYAKVRDGYFGLGIPATTVELCSTSQTQKHLLRLTHRHRGYHIVK